METLELFPFFVVFVVLLGAVGSRGGGGRSQLGTEVLGLGGQTPECSQLYPHLCPGKQSWTMTQQPLRGVTSLRFNQDQSERGSCLHPCGWEGGRERMAGGGC